MASIGVPPSPFQPTIEAPRSSILLNPHERPVIQESRKPAWQPTRGRPTAVRVVPPPIQTTVIPPSPNRSPNPATGTSDDGNKSPRIRFAPLPDPNRPRSLSTGHNVGHRVSEGPNGEREYTLELRNMTMDDEGLDDNAVDEDSISDEDDDDDRDYDWENDSRRRSWAVSMGSMSSMGMGSAWTGTKKLVGLKPDTPHKKSASGSFSSSPKNTAGFLSAGRRGSTASTGSNSSSTHRRAASSEAKPAKMLNGRVYGARRASEAAAVDKMRREQNEPAFVEWGNQGGVGTNSAAPSTLSRSAGSKSAFDDNDGGGMAWVRKRREERERKAREEAEAAAAAAAAAPKTSAEDASNPGMSPAHRPDSISSVSSTSSQREKLGTDGPLTPHDPPSELSGAFANFGGFGASTPNKRQSSLEVAPDAAAADHDSEQHLHTIKIPGSRFRRRSGDDEEEGVDDGDMDDGDFPHDEDDDEEVALVNQKCAAAAGVEVLARHF